MFDQSLTVEVTYLSVSWYFLFMDDCNWQVLLLREREENSATKSALIVTREENDVLNKKIVVADANMEQLRDTVKRLVAQWL
jgi:hypothetical protein